MLARPVPVYPQSRPQPGSVVLQLGRGAEDSTFVPGAEAELLAMVNEDRREHNLAPVLMNETLRRVARRHSHDMAEKGYIGHGTDQGESFLARMSKVLPRGTVVGENIAAAVSIAHAHAAFMHSQGHLKNILHPGFRWIGIGVATYGDLLITTEDFAE
jgi:uncharacterized protein YkwD